MDFAVRPSIATIKTDGNLCGRQKGDGRKRYRFGPPEGGIRPSSGFRKQPFTISTGNRRPAHPGMEARRKRCREDGAAPPAESLPSDVRLFVPAGRTEEKSAVPNGNPSGRAPAGIRQAGSPRFQKESSPAKEKRKTGRSAFRKGAVASWEAIRPDPLHYF